VIEELLRLGASQSMIRVVRWVLGAEPARLLAVWRPAAALPLLLCLLLLLLSLLSLAWYVWMGQLPQAPHHPPVSQPFCPCLPPHHRCPRAAWCARRRR
jgi:hypothetical protein